MGTGDPLPDFESMGVGVAWIRDMPYNVLWLPDERIAVLNASVSRCRLGEALQEFLPEMRAGRDACA